MKRAPIVLTGTACGLVAVIGYHAATPQASALTSGSSASSAASTLSAGGTNSPPTSAKKTTTSETSAAATTAATAKTTGTAKTAATAKTTATTAETTRSAVGSDVQYQYGDLEVKVTMTGSKITDVTVAKVDVYDPHSASIDQYALPVLRSQAVSAQSAQIDGVSGASYTSAAYEQSLQSAIDKLKA
jgi:uncharacterized protein with FMN-binding domain